MTICRSCHFSHDKEHHNVKFFGHGLLNAAILLIFLSLPAWAQTRLYFPTTTTPAVNPTIQTGWEDSSEIERRKLNNVKGATAITAGQTVDILEDQANYDDLDRQYTSTRMNAGIIFTVGVTTVRAVVMMREQGATDDVDKCILGIRIMSEDGQTERAALYSVGNYGPVLEFINNVSMRNKQCADGDLSLATYTTVLGDRLVVEIGYQTDGAETSPQAAAKWGENATDCAENETNTTDCAGWIEFSNAITFAGESAALKDAISRGVVPRKR
jgi:hypothetical protein